MKKQNLQIIKFPSRKRIRSLLALANGQELRDSLSSLMNSPEDWDEAMADPAAWMREQGLKLPRGMQAVMTKDISISDPVDPMLIGMPGPDWFPYNFKFTHCRTYWVPVRDDEGKLIKYREETICLGFEILLNPQPGPIG